MQNQTPVQKKDYSVCRECGQPLDETMAAAAKRRLQQLFCSVECLAKHELRRHACCEKATFINCVCEAATTCPDHGERHHGTHD